ncbi:MAG: 2-phospho-L-lactate guanylyltransferase [Actinobacteria bacterium]|nr:2-phospho-L-lactate guanylyltransferase [Actinomycetota bacterium]
MTPRAPAPAGVVIPIRAFDAAKSRLASAVGAAERSELMRAMAERVVAAAADLPTVVVSSAPEVTAWARASGLTCVPDPGTLNAAADVGRNSLAAVGVARLVVAHADLPLVESLTAVVAPGARPVAVIVPCHRDDGTPILSIPIDSDFRFAYGPGSFERHVAEAARVGLEIVELRDDPTLRRDVDSPADLDGILIPTPRLP